MNTMAQVAHLLSRDPEVEIKRLTRRLREAEKVRDAWCAEYVKVRNKLRRLTRKLSP